SLRQAYAPHEGRPARIGGDGIRFHWWNDAKHWTHVQPDHKEIARLIGAFVPDEGRVVVTERLLGYSDRDWRDSFLFRAFHQLIAQPVRLRRLPLERRDHCQVGEHKLTSM